MTKNSKKELKKARKEFKKIVHTLYPDALIGFTKDETKIMIMEDLFSLKVVITFATNSVNFILTLKSEGEYKEITSTDIIEEPEIRLLFILTKLQALSEMAKL